MTLAKITVSGKVTKNPEKRFTQSNLAITSFVIDIYPQDETLVRVLALGNLADKAADTLKMGDTVLVDGRMQCATVKTTSGRERKIIEINASSVDKVTFEAENWSPAGGYGGSSYNYNSSSNSQQAPAQNMSNAASGQAFQAQAPQGQNNAAPQQAQSSDIVQFAVDEISEDLIDEDEIPF